ncbi:MAG: hypothetical protein ISR58_21970 [Anaerolineales bacterium]|nr:hypothetical protein [Chloroflexota bacterium]MBL6983861.1 hypothetical protein [Anaerolineales bacterium]
MAPVVHGLEVEYYEQINFVYLDIDDPATEEFKRYFGFRYQPQFFLIDGAGNILQQWAGIVSGDSFRQSFNQALAQ